MKSKNLQNRTTGKICLVKIILAVLIGLISDHVFAQGNLWRINGNNNISANDFIGTTNNSDFKFKTNDTVRMTITKFGQTNIKGQLTVDSAIINGTLEITSAGESFIWQPNKLLPSPKHDNMLVTTGIYTIMKGIKTTGQILSDPNVKTGIGTETPNSKLHLFNPGLSAVYTLFTNDVNSNTTNGFQVGIQGNGFADLRQKQTLPMLFFTDDVERMRILADGKIGINTITPQNKLDINSGLVNTSGLRFSLLNSTSPPVFNPSNPTPKVLSVDASGNVILVPDAGGSGTLNNAQNGTSITSGTIVELGANPLLHNTDVPLNNFNLTFSTGTNPVTNNRIGFGTLTPGNKVEIDGTGAPTPSGLRFSLLNSGSSSITNPTNKILSVNGSGDVILVDDKTVIGGGSVNACSSLSPTNNYLSKWSNTSLNEICNSEVFEDPTTLNVGIGTVTPIARFDVRNSTNDAAVNVSNFKTNALTDNYGIKPDVTGSQSNNFAIWADAKSNSSSPLAQNYGVRASGSSTTGNSNANVGVYTFANGGTAYNAGVYAIGGSATTGGLNNYGGHFEASGGTNNYAIHATATSGNWAGFFVGNVHRSGTDNFTSDSTVKENINTIENALGIISQLKPHTFNFKTVQYPFMNFPSGNQFGLVAQEVETVLPELVIQSVQPEQLDSNRNVISPELSLKALNYQGLIPIALQGIKELDSTVTRLDTSAVTRGAATTADFVTKWTAPNVVGNSQIFDDGTSVDIGTITSGVSKFLVRSQQQPVAGDFEVTGTDVSGTPSQLAAVTGAINGLTPATNRTAVNGAVVSNSEGSNFGVNAVAFGSAGVGTGSINRGVKGEASGAVPLNRGVEGEADDSNGAGKNHYGGYFTAVGATDNNIGIYASNINYSGSVGNWAGYFDGDVNVNGTYYQNGSVFTSDQLFKTNVDSINNALGIISQLKPRTFYFDTTTYQGRMSFSNKRQYGLVAQDVATVLPELVSTTTLPAKYDSLGNVTDAAVDYKVLNYNAFIALLMKGQQEQQRQIDLMKTAMSTMQAQLSSCCSSNKMGNSSNDNNSNTQQNNNANITKVELVNAIILNQNSPNPFGEKTNITYTISNDSKGQIVFYDNTGRILKMVDITGAGTLEVFAENLSNGIYTYSIISDGKVVDTKKMVKTKE